MRPTASGLRKGGREKKGGEEEREGGRMSERAMLGNRQTDRQLDTIHG